MPPINYKKTIPPIDWAEVEKMLREIEKEREKVCQ